MKVNANIRLEVTGAVNIYNLANHQSDRSRSFSIDGDFIVNATEGAAIQLRDWMIAWCAEWPAAFPVWQAAAADAAPQAETESAVAPQAQEGTK